MSVDIFSLSDEELLKMDPSTLVDEPQDSQEPANANEQLPEEESPEPAPNEEAGEDQADAVGAGDEGAEAPDAEGEGQAETKEESDGEEAAEVADQTGAQGTEAKAEVPEADKSKAEEKTAEAVVDYEAEYKKLLAPFTANGREIAVKSVDEAIQLMQMGLGFNKKMAALKPNLKILKLLESNGLMTEDKIGYLIDLANKDTGAINKLIKESGIDPMDLSTDIADGYKTKVRPISDKELELDSVLEEIQETPTYQRTLGVVGKEWDEPSRAFVAENPQLLRVINDHIQRGVFDVIRTEVERERMFGRLQGVTDFDAYRQVGDSIQARGGFDHLSASGSAQGQRTSTQPVVVQPKPKQVDESRLKEKRRAAAPAKTAAGSSGSVPKDYNPLAMSDEDFSKLVKPSYL